MRILTRKLCYRKDDGVMCRQSKHTATPPSKITRLSDDSIQLGVMDVGVERTFSPQNFFMLPGSRWITFGLRRVKMLG